MSNTIQIKRSSTASAVPTAGQLQQGELAVNLADKKLYTKDQTNAVVLLNPDPPVPTPVGSIIYFAANTAPTGYLKANGAVVSRSTYAALFAAIGTTFGAGNGSTTFGLPDLRGEFLRGWDDGRGIDSGRAFGSAQGQAIQSHTHEAEIHFDDSTTPRTDFRASGAGAKQGNNATTLATGGTETRPRNIALLACIKF